MRKWKAADIAQQKKESLPSGSIEESFKVSSDSQREKSHSLLSG
ncbi:hypothetical protein VOA_001564 [Vibrio sp. RC586]|nr:hypothetical protein VOA_001564 [Vibrio sp. RC586]